MLSGVHCMRKVHHGARTIWTERAEHDAVGKTVDEVYMRCEAFGAVVEVEDELAREKLVLRKKLLFDSEREMMIRLRCEELS